MDRNERLLGFDIRLDSRDYLDSFWDNSEREMYLIRPNVKWPLSVDQLVWPSVFRYSGIGNSSQEDKRLPVNTQMAGNGLWFDLEMMTSWFKEQTMATGGRLGIPIAVHLFADPGLTMDQFGSDLIDRAVRPPQQAEDSLLLGFDIADAGQISGLADCGYSDEELRLLRPQWSPRLNEFGLLANLADAMKFRELTDGRVPEHSPFYVYSLYRLP